MSSRAGYWVCFCQQEIYNNQESPDKKYTLDYWKKDADGQYKTYQ